MQTLNGVSPESGDKDWLSTRLPWALPDISRAQFRFADGRDPHWWTRIRDGAMDVVLPGDAHGPDRQRLEVAQAVLPYLDAIERHAQRYLNAFPRRDWTVDGEDASDAWESVWLEFGSTLGEPLERFTLYLYRPAGDPNCLFHVTFRVSRAGPGQSQPLAFGWRPW